MIIKLTVKDNDFQEVLEKYLSKFFINIGKTREVTTENVVEEWQIEKRINKILNPNINDTLNDEDKKFLEEQIKKSFSFWCKSNYPKSEEYLSKNLQVSFLTSMTDKWENGESCYWFQHSGVVLTQ